MMVSGQSPQQSGLTLPTSNDSISFTAEVTTGSSSLMNQAIIQHDLVEALRQQALASLSAGDVAAKPQSMTYSFLDLRLLIQLRFNEPFSGGNYSDSRYG